MELCEIADICKSPYCDEEIEFIITWHDGRVFERCEKCTNLAKLFAQVDNKKIKVKRKFKVIPLIGATRKRSEDDKDKNDELEGVQDRTGT